MLICSCSTLPAREKWNDNVLLCSVIMAGIARVANARRA